jgi:DNA-binding CsgD family transcriptional regulator
VAPTPNNRARPIEPGESLNQQHQRLRDAALAQVSALSAGQVEVLGLLAGGYTEAETAQIMGISTGAVKRYRWKVARKLKIRGRIALLRLALRAGLSSVWTEPARPAARRTAAGPAIRV